MRHFAVLALLSSLLVLVMLGCDEENRAPYFTRFDIPSDVCGVAPFQAIFYPIASGGDPTPDPTGANMYLDISIDFGDGTPKATSVPAYHLYEQPGEYTVTVVVTDDDGDKAVIDTTMTVRADSLDVTATATYEGEPFTEIRPCDPIQFDLTAEACGFDPETGDYSRFIYRWHMNNTANTVYRGRTPVHAYAIADTGSRAATLILEEVARSITRRRDIPFLVRPTFNDLELQHTASDPSPADGDTITYTVLITNLGPDDAVAVRATERLDSVFRRVSYVDHQVSTGIFTWTSASRSGIWEIPEILSGESVTLTLRGVVGTGPAGQTIRNQANITATCRPDPDTSNNAAFAEFVSN